MDKRVKKKTSLKVTMIHKMYSICKKIFWESAENGVLCFDPGRTQTSADASLKLFCIETLPTFKPTTQS